MQHIPPSLAAVEGKVSTEKLSGFAQVLSARKELFLLKMETVTEIDIIQRKLAIPLTKEDTLAKKRDMCHHRKRKV